MDCLIKSLKSQSSELLKLFSLNLSNVLPLLETPQLRFCQGLPMNSWRLKPGQFSVPSITDLATKMHHSGNEKERNFDIYKNSFFCLLICFNNKITLKGQYSPSNIKVLGPVFLEIRRLEVCSSLREVKSRSTTVH